MADRFPSLDDFDAGQTEVQPDTSSNDFLARERAALGEDASQFTSSADNAATVEEGSDDDNDLLGGGGGGGGNYDGASSYPTNGNSNTGAFDDDLGDFESSFPAVDTSNSAVGATGTVTGTTAPFQAQSRGYDDYEDDSEPQVLRDWREKRDQQIQHRDEVSASKKAETVKAAQANIDEFYENYNNRKDKGIAQTRKEAEEFLKNREDTTSGGTSWERIAKLVDLSGKGVSGGASGTQKAKMRELLISLRKDEKAPGASGV